jgi:tryptophanyl-tRNA synthetase
MSALIQVGDILLPQLKDFGGPKPVVVPVGADQDPHIRLTRDLASKYHDQFGFIVPSATFHKLTRSLSGEAKMSKRDPMSYLLLNDSPEIAKKKVLSALTGGRKTIELHRKLGGEPEKCVVYELGLFHFIEDDSKVKQIYEECTSGKRICGDCKHEHAEYVANFLKAHQRKRKSLMDTARKLLTQEGKSPKHLSF